MDDTLKEFYELEEGCSCDGNCTPCKKAREKLHKKAMESYKKIVENKIEEE